MRLLQDIDDDFDIAIFTDLDEELMRFALSLPPHIKKILHLCESPIYTPYGHHPHILFSNIWSSVVTYNREFDSSRLQHYDIPVTGIQCPLPSIPSVKALFLAESLLVVSKMTAVVLDFTETT